ncbi:MAG: hypothetical protein FJ125_14205, partial [Deltaproteobacteria bacterium]|nr:hypothetical protein [Deltaproteobacteria bacterium]
MADGTAEDDGEESGPPQPSSTVRALFSLEQRTLPFPNDLFTVESPDTITGLRLSLGEQNTLLVDEGMKVLLGPARLVAWLNELDGFSISADLLVGLDGEIDPASLPETVAAAQQEQSPVFLLDVQPGSAHRGERHPILVAAERFDDALAGLVHLLVVRPDLPLRPQNRYALVVRSTVRGADGSPLGRAADFAVAAGLRRLPEGHPAAAQLGRARAQLEPVLEQLATAEPPLLPAELALVSVFTTQSATALVGSMRTMLRSAAAPPLAVELGPDGDDHPDLHRPAELPDAPEDPGDLSGIDFILRGTFTAPELRGASGEPIRTDAALLPVVTGIRRIPFLLALPVDPTAQPFPLVVLQHGHGARKEFLLYLAGFFARQGMATAAIDAVAHGELAEDAPFLALPDVPRIRDNFLQTAANQLRLVQALESLGGLDLVPAGVGDGQPDLDLQRPLGYVGESLGGIAGALFTAQEPRIGAVIINEAGGGLGLMLDALADAGLRQGPKLALLELSVILQTFVDRMDPVSYARLLVAEPPPGA